MREIMLIGFLFLGSLYANDAKSSQESKCDKYQTLADSFMKIAEKRWEMHEDATSAASMSSMYSSMYNKECSVELITLSDGTECVKNSSPRCFQMPSIIVK